MPNNSVTIGVNTNYHHAAGKDLFKTRDMLFNSYREKWRKWPESFYVGDFPLFIDIEATSICNLKCPFCATTFREDRIKKGFISFSNVKKIIDEGKNNGLFGVKFNIRGEPLLHPKIYDFVNYAKKSGLIDVYFNTNATLLNEVAAKRLIDTGLDRISISVEGYTKDFYEKFRKGANFEIVLSNIEKLQDLKRRLRVGHPQIRIQAVLLPDMECIIGKYKKFWLGKADEVAFLDYKMMENKRKGIRAPWACPQLWQRMSVWWDGTILPCNHDDDGLMALGNINKTTIGEAWHSEKINQVRRVHKKGLSHNAVACDGCYFRDSEISKLTKKVNQL